MTRRAFLIGGWRPTPIAAATQAWPRPYPAKSPWPTGQIPIGGCGARLPSRLYVSDALAARRASNYTLTLGFRVEACTSCNAYIPAALQKETATQVRPAPNRTRQPRTCARPIPSRRPKAASRVAPSRSCLRAACRARISHSARPRIRLRSRHLPNRQQPRCRRCPRRPECNHRRRPPQLRDPRPLQQALARHLHRALPRSELLKNSRRRAKRPKTRPRPQRERPRARRISRAVRRTE